MSAMLDEDQQVSFGWRMWYIHTHTLAYTRTQSEMIPWCDLIQALAELSVALGLSEAVAHKNFCLQFSTPSTLFISLLLFPSPLLRFSPQPLSEPANRQPCLSSVTLTSHCSFSGCSQVCSGSRGKLGFSLYHVCKWTISIKDCNKIWSKTLTYYILFIFDHKLPFHCFRWC